MISYMLVHVLRTHPSGLFFGPFLSYLLLYCVCFLRIAGRPLPGRKAMRFSNNSSNKKCSV